MGASSSSPRMGSSVAAVVSPYTVACRAQAGQFEVAGEPVLHEGTTLHGDPRRHDYTHCLQCASSKQLLVRCDGPSRNSCQHCDGWKTNTVMPY